MFYIPNEVRVVWSSMNVHAMILVLKKCVLWVFFTLRFEILQKQVMNETDSVFNR